MGLEPSRLLADLRRALARLLVAYMHEALPHPLHAERIGVDLGEAVDEVHLGRRVGHPADAVVVVGGELARLVVLQ